MHGLVMIPSWKLGLLEVFDRSILIVGLRDKVLGLRGVFWRACAGRRCPTSGSTSAGCLRKSSLRAAKLLWIERVEERWDDRNGPNGWTCKGLRAHFVF